jgi:hypothetical protein
MATARVIRLTVPYPAIWPEFSICIAHSQVKYPLLSANNELVPRACQTKTAAHTCLTHLPENNPLPNQPPLDAA